MKSRAIMIGGVVSVVLLLLMANRALNSAHDETTCLAGLIALELSELPEDCTVEEGIRKMFGIDTQKTEVRLQTESEVVFELVPKSWWNPLESRVHLTLAVRAGKIVGHRLKTLTRPL